MSTGTLYIHKVYKIVYDLNNKDKCVTYKSDYILGLCIILGHMINAVIVASTDLKKQKECMERLKSNTEMFAMVPKSTDIYGKHASIDSCAHLNAYSSLFCCLGSYH